MSHQFKRTYTAATATTTTSTLTFDPAPAPNKLRRTSPHPHPTAAAAHPHRDRELRRAVGALSTSQLTDTVTAPLPLQQPNMRPLPQPQPQSQPQVARRTHTRFAPASATHTHAITSNPAAGAPLSGTVPAGMAPAPAPAPAPMYASGASNNAAAAAAAAATRRPCYLDELPQVVCKRLVRHVIGTIRRAPLPSTPSPYPRGLSWRIARAAIELIQMGGALGTAARAECRTITERERLPADDADGLVLCTKESADYSALALFLNLAPPTRIVFEADAVPKRYTKLLMRHATRICSLGVYFRFAARGHELDRLLAAATSATPLELLEADFEETDGSFIRAIEKHVHYVRRLRLCFTGSKKIKPTCSLRDIWLLAGHNLLEAAIVSSWGERFEALNVLLRECPNASVTINGRRVR